MRTTVPPMASIRVSKAIIPSSETSGTIAALIGANSPDIYISKLDEWHPKTMK